MSVKSAFLRVAGRFAPYCYQPPAGVLFPYYHIVSDVVPPHVRNLFDIPRVDKFEEDIDSLCAAYKPLELADLEKFSHSNEPTAPHSFLLSFDDGMKEVYEVVAPILRAKGIPAILFVNSSTVDNKQLMWRHKISLLIEQIKGNKGRIPIQLNAYPGITLQEKLKSLRYADEKVIDELAAEFGVDFEDYLKCRRPYLTAEEVRELERYGFAIGAHSVSHPQFDELRSRDQEQQIKACAEFIRSIGVSCRYFAFPFHDKGVTSSTFHYMKSVGLELSFGTSEARLDSVEYSFQRFALDAGNSQVPLQNVLDQLSVKALLRQITGTIKIARN